MGRKTVRIRLNEPGERIDLAKAKTDSKGCGKVTIVCLGGHELTLGREEAMGLLLKHNQRCWHRKMADNCRMHAENGYACHVMGKGWLKGKELEEMVSHLKGLMGEDECEGWPVLDRGERKYLRALIRPFRDGVACIRRVDFLNGNSRIEIHMWDGQLVALPEFRTGAMYGNMDDRREYALRELGL